MNVSMENQILGRLFYEAVKSQSHALYHNVLDVGCGYGIAAAYIHVLSEKITLIDISKSAIDFLFRQWQHDDNVKVVNGTIHTICGCYDLIYYFLSFHHIADTTSELSKIRSLLASDGELIICEMYSTHGFPFHLYDAVPYDGFTPQCLSTTLQENGFGITQMKKIAKFHHNNSDFIIYIIRCIANVPLKK
jgi:Methyltransferase domain.